MLFMEKFFYFKEAHVPRTRRPEIFDEERLKYLQVDSHRTTRELTEQLNYLFQAVINHLIFMGKP